MRNYWSSEKVKYLTENRNAQTLFKLRDNLGFKSVTSIKSKVKKLKLKSKTNRKGSLMPLLEDTPIAFYWAGFILADGYITDGGHLMLSLAMKDKSQVFKLGAFLGCIPKLTYPTTGYNTNPFYRVSVKDGIVGVEIRNKFDFKNKKTYNPPDLGFLFEDWMFYSFLIGFIDGDGYIKNKNIKIESSREYYSVFEFIHERLNVLFGKKVSSIKFSIRGYAWINIHAVVYKYLKEFIKVNKLTTLNRKWI